MSKTDKDLKHIAKKSIDIGDQLKTQFDESKEVDKATAAIKAYQTGIKAIVARKYKS